MGNSGCAAIETDVGPGRYNHVFCLECHLLDEILMDGPVAAIHQVFLGAQPIENLPGHGGVHVGEERSNQYPLSALSSRHQIQISATWTRLI